MLYGYRGLVVEWDYGGMTTVFDSATTATTTTTVTTSATYRLNGEDEASFTEDMDWRPDDFHRTYCPYRRLIGSDVMNQFTAAASQNGGGRGAVVSRATATLSEYVRRLQGEPFARDQIQPVCRPITALGQRPAHYANHRGRQPDQSNNDVFMTDHSPVERSLSSVQRPLAMGVANHMAADKHNGQYAGTTPASSVRQERPDAAHNAERRRSSTSESDNDDSDRFLETSDSTPEWSPSKTANTNVTNGRDVMMYANDVTKNNDNRHSLGDEMAAMAKTHVVTNQSTDVRNGWPIAEPVHGNDVILYNNDNVMVTKFDIIEENTRKTIRSDI